MPPTLYLVRHAESQNDKPNCDWIQDALLTDHGRNQANELRRKFHFAPRIGSVMSSPLRRAIETASIAFSETLAEKRRRRLTLLPLAQDVNSQKCNIGYTSDELKEQLPRLLATANKPIKMKKVDFSCMELGWNVKSGEFAPEREAVEKRAAKLRSWFYQRTGNEHIVLVSHREFLQIFTEDSSVSATDWRNCEVRIFNFTALSTPKDAHLEETWESKNSRLRPV